MSPDGQKVWQWSIFSRRSWALTQPLDPLARDASTRGSSAPRRVLSCSVVHCESKALQVTRAGEPWAQEPQTRGCASGSRETRKRRTPYDVEGDARTTMLNLVEVGKPCTTHEAWDESPRVAADGACVRVYPYAFAGATHAYPVRLGACSASLALDGVASTFCFPRFFAASRWPRVVETGVGTPTPLQLPTAAYGILEFFQRCHPLDSFFCLCRSKKVTRVFCRGGRFCRGAVCRVVETGDAQEEGRRAWGRHGEEVPSQE